MEWRRISVSFSLCVLNRQVTYLGAFLFLLGASAFLRVRGLGLGAFC